MYNRNDSIMKTLALYVNRNDLVIKIFHLQLLHVGGFCTVIRMCYRTISLLGLRIYICMYILIEKRYFHVNILLYVFGEK